MTLYWKAVIELVTPIHAASKRATYTAFEVIDAV
jgi:hypothetical protein